MRSRARLGSIAVQVAGDVVVITLLHARRERRRAPLESPWAARGEEAARWKVERVRDGPGDGAQRPAARRQARDGRQQPLGIRMHGSMEDLINLAVRDDLARVD